MAKYRFPASREHFSTRGRSSEIPELFVDTGALRLFPHLRGDVLSPVPVVHRPQVLLKSEAGLIDAEIAEHVGLTVRAIAGIRRRCCLAG